MAEAAVVQRGAMQLGSRPLVIAAVLASTWPFWLAAIGAWLSPAAEAFQGRGALPTYADAIYAAIFVGPLIGVLVPVPFLWEERRSAIDGLHVVAGLTGGAWALSASFMAIAMNGLTGLAVFPPAWAFFAFVHFVPHLVAGVLAYATWALGNARLPTGT